MTHDEHDRVLRVTHLVAAGRHRGDAVGTLPDGSRMFVPNVSGCGECAVCRRGWPGACASATSLFPTPPPVATTVALSVRFPGRFSVPIDQGGGGVPGEIAAGAGVVAEAIEAVSRAGVGPGETTIWMGADPMARAGMALCRARGARVYAFATDPGSFGTLLPATQGPAAWAAILDADETAASGRTDRRIFLVDPTDADFAAALALAAPGTNLVVLGGQRTPALDLSRLRGVRTIVMAGFHPDFIVEALAALARGDVAGNDLVITVEAANAELAAREFLEGRQARLPVVALPDPSHS